MSKRVPLAYAVLPPAKANKELAAANKTALAQKIHELTNGLEKILVSLVQVATTGERDADRIKSSEILLHYAVGKPVETSISLDATPKSGLGSLSAEQLTALASAPTAPSLPEEDEGEIVPE